MPAVTIRITECPDHDFDVLLIEDDGTQTSGLLRRTELTTGNWTANVDALAPPPDTDIVKRVSGAPRHDRNHLDYAEIAETLHSWLFPAGPVLARWTALDRAVQPSAYVDATHDALTRLPWELARGAPPGRRAPAIINGMYRLAQQMPTGAPGTPWPFRILIVVGCSKEDEAELCVEQEVQTIERVFLPMGRSVNIHRLVRPDRDEFRDFVREYAPNVFHFAGHGGKRTGPNGTFGLRIENPVETWIWTGDAVAMDLPAWRWTPRFAFLNACRSAVEQTGVWSVQQSFLAAGTKAVVGMQADTRGDLAGAFAAKLYHHVAQGHRLEYAAHEARLPLVNNPDEIDWALPTVAMNCRELCLVDPRPVPADTAFRQCKEFEEARFFADCRDSRRRLTRWGVAAVLGEPAKNVLFISGERKTGKTHLLKWAMENWAIGGARIRYIEMNDSRIKEFISVLRQIRDGEADASNEATHYLHAGLPATEFRRFNWELNNVTRAGVLGEWVEADHPEPEIPDRIEPLVALGERTPHEIIGPGFIEALRASGAVKPLILVFDNFPPPEAERLLPPSEFVKLVRYIFGPMIGVANSSVKLVFAATPPAEADYGLSTLPEEHLLRHEMPTNIPDQELPKLAAEMLRFQKEALIEQVTAKLLELRPPGSRNGLAFLERVRKALEAMAPELLQNVVRMR